jgi:hypothetical protein
VKFVFKYGKGTRGVGAKTIGAMMMRWPRGAELWSLPSSIANVRAYISELVYPQVRQWSEFTLVSFVGHACFGRVEGQCCGVEGRIWELNSNWQLLMTLWHKTPLDLIAFTFTVLFFFNCFLHIRLVNKGYILQNFKDSSLG